MSAYALQEKTDVKSDEIDFIKLYFDEIVRTPLLTFEEELALSRRIAGGDTAALNTLIEANLLLVVKIARHFVTKEYHLLDVIQDGNIGLIKAAEKYDYKHGVRFSTYAAWWIKQSIVRSLSLKKRLIRLPHRKEETLRRLRKVHNFLSQSLGRTPSTAELAEEMFMEVHEVETLLNMENPIVSFENVLLDKESFFSNTIEDTSFSPDQVVFSESLRREVSEILDSLPPREKMVLDDRYGFGAEEKTTLKKIADQFGISAETVRQIELRALQKIRGKHSYLKEYLGN